jgi:hypothetical protein
MSSGWQIYYDFLSATTKLLSPKSRWLRFAKMRVAFVSPKSVAVPVRAQVARFIIGKQWYGAGGHLLQPQVGLSPWLRLPKRHWLRFAKMRRALMLRSIAARAQTLARVGCAAMRLEA